MHFVTVCKLVEELSLSINIKKGKEMFCLTTHSTHFIYGHMASVNIKMTHIYTYIYIYIISFVLTD